jgi:hypothetical protein
VDLRPFLFDEQDDFGNDPRNINYWLILWINTYSYLLKNLPSRAIFLGYESLCEDTEFIWKELSKKIDLVPYNRTILFSKSYYSVNNSVSQDLILKSDKIYKELAAKLIGSKENTKLDH